MDDNQWFCCQLTGQVLYTLFKWWHFKWCFSKCLKVNVEWNDTTNDITKCQKFTDGERPLTYFLNIVWLTTSPCLTPSSPLTSSCLSLWLQHSLRNIFECCENLWVMRWPESQYDQIWHSEEWSEWNSHFSLQNEKATRVVILFTRWHVGCS